MEKENNFINQDFGQTIKFYYASVVKSDKDETEKTNAVQFKISPIHDGFDDSALPWCYPLSQFFGSTENSGSNNVPLVNSFIWVTKIFNRWFYAFNANQQTSNLASKYFDEIQNNLGELDNIIAPSLEYPNAISFFYESGLCITYSVDSEKPIYSLYHPGGSYVVIDIDGNIGAYSAKNIELKTKEGVHLYSNDKNYYFEDGNNNQSEYTNTGIKHTDKNNNIIEMNATSIKVIINGTNKCKIENSSINLKTVLNSLIDQIKNIITTGSPPVHTVNNASQLALEAVKQQLNLLLD